MIRTLLALAAAVLVAGDAPAQIIAGASVGSGSFGGGFRSPPAAPGLRNMPRGTGANLSRSGQNARIALYWNRPPAGYFPMYPYHSLNYGGGFIGSGLGGGFVGNRFYNPFILGPWGGGGWFYDFGPQFVPIEQAQPGPPEPFVPFSGEFTATLTLEFPAPASISLNGKELDGEPAISRTLTSPSVKPGEVYKFNIRARWMANGRTYEATREVAVGPGDRTRLLIVSGTTIEEK